MDAATQHPGGGVLPYAFAPGGDSRDGRRDLKAVDAAPLAGLDDAEATRRLDRDGPNEPRASSIPRLLRRVANLFREPILMLLLACAAVYALSGLRADALTLLGFLAVLVATAAVLALRDDLLTETLRRLSSPRPLVIRSGRELRVAGRELVRGDLLVLAAGDRLAADATLLRGSGLVADESWLTGATTPVAKEPTDPGGVEPPRLYRDSLIVAGNGVAQVIETGAALRGDGGGDVTAVQRAGSRLQRRAMWIGLAAGGVAAALFGLSRGDWLRGLLAGLTLAMGLLPEELSLVVTVLLATGAWRLARQRVLTRRLGALEVLGATTVILADQSGRCTVTRPAVAESRVAGIRVVILTAEDPAAASECARRAGLEPAGGVVAGATLEAASPVDFRRQAREAAVFCGLTAAQKLRLVETLQGSGEVVALTGAAVDDAPALHRADVGIAMGEDGTDLAREAASLVLLDDDFPAILSAIRLGRRLADNLRHVLAFLIAVHVPIIGLALLPVLLGWKLVLLPAHLLLLELIVHPACALVFEAERGVPELMRRPPGRRVELLQDRASLSLGLLQGLVILATVLAAHEITMLARGGNEVARATSFTALVVGGVGLVYSSRSRTRSVVAALRERNPTLWWMTGFVAMLLATILWIPALAARFAFGEPPPGFILVGFLSGLLAVGLIDAVKLRYAGLQTSFRSTGAAPGNTRSS
jgi:magnesium-transporting ATPase (P-type)